jgi:hypothetical protein
MRPPGETAAGRASSREQFIGLVPVLQWIALPPAALVLTRRHYLGAVHELDSEE